MFVFAALVLGAETLAPIQVKESRLPGTPAALVSEFQGEAVTLDPRGETSLVRVLSRSTSLYALRAGSDSSPAPFSVRGQDPTQTRYYLNGVPLTDAQFHSSPVSWFPADAVGSVDVFAEGTPAQLGGDGLGGAIALNLSSPRQASTWAGARLGSFGARRLFAKASTSNPLGFSLFVEGQLAREDYPYRYDGGTPLVASDDTTVLRQHNGQRSFAVLPQLEIRPGAHSRLELFGFHTSRSHEVPGPTGLPLHGLLDIRYSLMGARFSSRQMGVGDWSVLGYGWALGQNFSADRELNALQIQNSSSQAYGARFHLDQEWGGLAVQWSGGMHGDKALLSTSYESLSASRTLIPIGLSAQWQWVPQLRLKAATLVQRASYRGLSSREEWGASFRLGADWIPTSADRIHGLLGHFFRFPSLVELYGSPAALIANPGLKSERAWKAELGWQKRWVPSDSWMQKAEASLILSAALADELITLIPNSQQSYSAQNTGSSLILSPEAGLLIDVSPLLFRLNGTGLFAQNISDSAIYYGKQLPLRPSFRSGAEVEWSRSQWKVAYAIQTTGPLFMDAANTKQVGTYWEHSLWGSWQTSGFGMWLVELRNITDSTTVAGNDWGFFLNQNSTGVAGFPAPGRRVYLTWKYEI